MAINQVLGSDKAVRLNDFSLLGLVQSFSWNPNFNAQDIFELGNTTKLDTAKELTTSGSWDMASSGNTAGLLARMKVQRTGASFTGFQYNTGNKNAYTFTQDDLAEMKMDLLVHEKTDQKTFNRTHYLPQCYLTSFSGSADASGMASEAYNWGGSFVTVFPTPYHDLRSAPATRATSTTATLIPGDGVAITNAVYTPAFAVVDGRVFTNKTTDATYITISGSNTVTFTTTESYTIPVGAMIMVAFYKTTGSTTFPTISDSTDRFKIGTKPVFYVKGHSVNIWLVPDPASLPANASATASDTSRWLRAQSIDWNVDLRVDTLRQILKNQQASTIYSQTPQYPLDVSVNLRVTETDFADWQSLLTGANKNFGSPTNVHQATLDFAPESISPEFGVVVEYYAKTGEKIQQWQFKDLRVDGFGSRIAVGGRGEITWSLRGSEIRLEGLNP